MELEDLTRQYLQTAAREWATLEAGDAAVPLTDVFVLLEAVERPRPWPTECPPDLAALEERLEHVGVEPSPPPPALRATPSPLLLCGRGGGGRGVGVRAPSPLLLCGRGEGVAAKPPGVG